MSVDMQTSSNQWMLFGFDVRTLGQLWLGAWRDLLFASTSPLRQRFDEPVRLIRETGESEQVYQAGKAIAKIGDVGLTALLLPDDYVLSRTLTVPTAVEAELQSVLDMEVASGSPFGMEDTVYGFEELERNDASISLVLAIASRSNIGEWLRSRDVRDGAASQAEVWAEVDGAMLCLRGFGETARDGLYRQRLVRVGLLGGAALLLLLLVASLFAMQQRIGLSALAEQQRSVELEAQSVSAMRETLVSANEGIRAANEIVAQYPNPHVEIARLTELLDDDVYVAHFSMRGPEMRIRGRAVDAAVVMQKLAQSGAYASVTAPQAITAVGNTGLEQFHLDISVAASDAATEAVASDAQAGGL